MPHVETGALNEETEIVHKYICNGKINRISLKFYNLNIQSGDGKNVVGHHYSSSYYFPDTTKNLVKAIEIFVKNTIAEIIHF